MCSLIVERIEPNLQTEINATRLVKDDLMSRNIIIDTDPGQDDAVAILLALASPELNVLGLTCVAGNVPLARTSS